MEQKFTSSQENVPQKSLDEIKKNFKDEIIQAIEKGKLTPEMFIEFRKGMDEIMGSITIEVEKKRFEK